MKKYYNRTYLSLKKMIFFILFIGIAYALKKSNKIDLSNEIIIKINGKGNQSILYSQYSNKPDEVLINGNSYIIDNENKIILF